MTADSPQFILIGAGAIAESFYLPALRKSLPDIDRLHLVDTSQQRLEEMAQRFALTSTGTDFRPFLGSAAGVIVAAPNHLHAEMVRTALEYDCHVLCEKPLALHGEEARGLVELAVSRNLALAVNNTRRLFPGYQLIAELVAAGEIGPIEEIDIEEGGPYAWPTVSGFYFRPGGERAYGVFMDRGSHVIDTVCWWLGTRPELVSHRDDSRGGCETVTETHLAVPDGARVRVKLSWLTKLRNTGVIRGREGEIAFEAYDWQRFSVTRNGRSRKVRAPGTVRRFSDFAERLVDNFIAVVRGDASPLIAGADVLDSIAIIEAGYEQRQAFPTPWLDWNGPGREEGC